MTSSKIDSHSSTREAPKHGDRRWWLLAAMCIAQLMIILDATILNVALPDAQRSLGFGAAERHWVVTAYALAFGSLLLIGGRIADLIGRRKAVLIGLIGFGLASGLGGASVDLTMLIVARALQGVFGALLAPAALAVITTTFTNVRERGKAFGIYGSVSAGGGAAGLLLGGVLTEYVSWRWTLYVNVVLALIGTLAALATLRDQKRERAQRLDIAGTVTVTLGLLGLVYGFSNAYEHGWNDPITILSLAGGVILIAGFAVIESRVSHPILPLRVLASRVRSASLLVLFLGSVGLFTVILFLTYYLQENLGFTPLQAGLAFLPQALGAVGASLASGILLRRLPGSLLISIGLTMAAAGSFLLGRIGAEDTYASVVLPGVTLLGAGVGLALSIALNLAIFGVRPEDAGVASASANAVQQIGGSIGPSLFNTIAGSALATYVASRGVDVATLSGDDPLLGLGAVYSYSVAFNIIGAILLVGAVLGGLLIETHRRRELRPIK